MTSVLSHTHSTLVCLVSHTLQPLVSHTYILVCLVKSSQYSPISHSHMDESLLVRVSGESFAIQPYISHTYERISLGSCVLWKLRNTAPYLTRMTALYLQRNTALYLTHIWMRHHVKTRIWRVLVSNVVGLYSNVYLHIHMYMYINLYMYVHTYVITGGQKVILFFLVAGAGKHQGVCKHQGMCVFVRLCLSRTQQCIYVTHFNPHCNPHCNTHCSAH